MYTELDIIFMNLKGVGYECRPTSDPAIPWATFELSLQKLYCNYFTPEEVEARFELPPLVAGFLERAEGMYHWKDETLPACYRTSHNSVLYDRHEVLRMVGYQLNLWKPGPDNLMWVPIGQWMESGPVIVCCDKSYKHFGCVLEIRDGHPWNGSEYIQVGYFDSFTTFSRDPD